MINNKLIKVCGMRNHHNIQELEELEVDFIGFIFYEKSPRCAIDMPPYLSNKKSKVGVFVNEEIATIIDIARQYDLNTIQLHGQENTELCKQLFQSGYEVIKAFSVESKEDLLDTKEYEPYCHYFLFDTKCKEHGGSGRQFDWEVLHYYNGSRPFLLSGGIGPDCANRLKRFEHPKLMGYDLNSCFEITPGIKEINKVSHFIANLK